MQVAAEAYAAIVGVGCLASVETEGLPPFFFLRLLEAVGCIHDFLLRQSSGTGLQAGHRPFVSADSGDSAVANVDFQETAAAAGVVATGGYYFALGT